MKGKRGKKMNGADRNASRQRAAILNGEAPSSLLAAPGARQLRTVDPRNRRRQRAAITPVPPFLREPGS